MVAKELYLRQFLPVLWRNLHFNTSVSLEARSTIGKVKGQSRTWSSRCLIQGYNMYTYMSAALMH